MHCSPVVRFVNTVLYHKPDEKAKASDYGGFKGVGTQSMLHKEYPSAGPYTGGIVFRRYYGGARHKHRTRA